MLSALTENGCVRPKSYVRIVMKIDYVPMHVLTTVVISALYPY